MATISDLFANKTLKAGSPIRYLGKDGSYYKAEVISFDSDDENALVLVKEGPSEGKKLRKGFDDLKRPQGRQAGFSPVAKPKAEKAKETVKTTAKSGTTAGKPKADTSKFKVTGPEWDLDTAREALRDLHENFKDGLETLTGIITFLESVEATEEDDAGEEEEAEPEPKKTGKKTTRGRPMKNNDADEE